MSKKLPILDNTADCVQKRPEKSRQQLSTDKKCLPGFSGEWKTLKIGDIAVYSSEKNIKQEPLPVLTCSKNLGFVDSLAYFKKQIFSKDTTGYKLIRYGEFGYPKNHIEEGAIGYQNIHDVALVSPIYEVFCTNKTVDNEFLYITLKTDAYRQKFRAATSASVDRRGSLPWSSFAKIELRLPPLPEQQKIARILSAWDNAINCVQKLLENSRQQKKTLMQQLLTRKKRLPGFSGEWKTTKLKELGSSYLGLTKKSGNDFGKGKQYVPYKNVFTNFFVDASLVEFVCIKPNESQNKLAYGDILFTISSEIAAESGMSSVVLFEPDELYLNSFCSGFRPNNMSSLIPCFAGYLFRSTPVRSEITKLAQGSTRFNISYKKLLLIKVTLPPLPEQTAIAKVLSSADAVITQYEDKLANLQSQKKALMQQLLTGKKRVKVDALPPDEVV